MVSSPSTDGPPAYRLIASTDRFIVIDKAPGVSVHRDQDEAGLVMQVERDLGCKLWLVHRLDRITSGLMLLARDAASCALLAAQFEQRQVQKFYLALSDRKPSKKQGKVTGDMVRGRRSSWKLVRSHDNPAVTEFFSQSAAPGVRVLLCRPYTGQTHQIRVALKSIGAPIIGDPLYHEAVNPPADRGYLHAWQLFFNLDGQAYHYTADPQVGALFHSVGVQEALARWQDPLMLEWHPPR